MKKAKTLLVTVSLLLLGAMGLHLFGCTQAQAQTQDLMEGIVPNEVSGQPVDDVFADAQMALALKLFQASFSSENPQNVLISPLSIQLALAMTANGADGQTLAEMEALLGNGMTLEELNEYLVTYVNGLSSEEKCKLALANSIWFRDDENRFVPEQTFLQTNADYYGAQVYKAKFDRKTCDDINKWVNTHTDEMIPRILDEIDESSVMYLINALAFDAEWQTIYDKSDVRDGSFTSSAGELQAVEMMSSIESRYIDTDDAKGVVKNYKGGKYSFVAMLPDEDVTLEDYIENLDAEELMAAISNPDSKSVFVSLPKFSYEYDSILNDALKELGMPTAFDGGEADFSRMGQSSERLHIGRVVHKTYISVDERGTRAGAATIVEMVDGLGPSFEEILCLERPFLYMIVDNTNHLPIFIGTLTSVA